MSGYTVIGRRWRTARRAGFAAVLAPIAGLAPAAATQSGGEPTQTVVVEVGGAVGAATIAMVQRGIREVRARGAGRLVIDIDTAGGTEWSAAELTPLIAAIRDEGVPTAAFVQRQALSWGAYVALACREVYMAPGAGLGAIAPALGDPWVVSAEQLATLRAEVEARLAGRTDLRRDARLLAQAMVDPDMRVFELTYEDDNGLTVTKVVGDEEVRRLEAAGRRILARKTFGDSPLVLGTDDARRFGFVKGIHGSLEDLIREEYLHSMAQTLVLEENWSESAVAWLDSIKPVLFVLGFLLLLVELKTPGFAVPGALGVAFLGLGLFSSYLVGLADWTEIVLFVLGLGALAVEIFVMPGTLIFGAVGLVSVVAALILSQQTFVLPSSDAERDVLQANLLNLLLLVVGVIAAFAVYVKMLPRIPFLNRVLLTPPQRSPSPAVAAASGTGGSTLVGRVGVALTDLRPAGIVEIDDQRFDAHSRGDYLAAGSGVRVVSMAYQRLVVEEAGNGPGAESGQVSLGVLFLLLAVGLVLVIGEIFFVSFGVLGTLSALSLFAAIFLAFTHHGQTFGFLFLALTAVGVPLIAIWALRTLPNTGFGRRLLLSGPDPGELSRAGTEPGIETFLHQHGEAVSVLRPAGIARIGGRRVDVVTRGEMIEPGTPVKVVAVDGNRVVVAARRPTENP